MYNESSIETKTAVPSGRGEYFAGIIVCTVLLYVFNNLLNLYVLSIPEGSNIFKAIMTNAYTQVSLPFLTDKFINCLWGINLALGLGLMGNFTLLLYRPRWFHYFLQAVMIATGIVPVYLVYGIFPFNLNSILTEKMVLAGLLTLVVLLILRCLYMLVKGAVVFVRTIRNFELL